MTTLMKFYLGYFLDSLRKATACDQGFPKKKIKCSTSGKGNCWDNAVVNSFFATLKDQLEILDGLIRDPEQLLCDLWVWIEAYYNRKRRHSAIGYLSPIVFEERHAQRTQLMLTVV